MTDEPIATVQSKPLSDDLWISYPVAGKCLAYLRLLFRQPPSFERNHSAVTTARLMHRYQGMMIVGKTGNGKTEILQKFMRTIDGMAGGEVFMVYPGKKISMMHHGKKMSMIYPGKKVSLKPIVFVETPLSNAQNLFKEILDEVEYPIGKKGHKIRYA